MDVSGKVLILGCGNILLGDDGFGPAVARRCRRLKLGRSILSLDVGTGLSSFLLEVTYGDRRPKGLVVVDSADGGRPPGEVFEVGLRDLDSRSTDTFGLHDFPSAAVFRELESSKGIRTRIVACQPRTGVSAVGVGLSPEVEAAVGVASRLAVEMALEMSRAASP
ncbi:MAG TPA: hydrogenase maturation protease [Conexivisphaerales archaeon]|nr:hydrogenase maturation protease [Conexivisphaerales archaeon]